MPADKKRDIVNIIKNINNDPVVRAHEKRINNLPPETQAKLNELSQKDPKELQFCVIKRKRAYPQKGDVFVFSIQEAVYFYGKVLNNHINLQGDDLLLVALFKSKTRSPDLAALDEIGTDLLLPPWVVGQEYWTRGYFFNVGLNDPSPLPYTYGFYHSMRRCFVDEYDNNLDYVPDYYTARGVATDTGVSYAVQREVIIDPSLLKFDARGK